MPNPVINRRTVRNNAPSVVVEALTPYDDFESYSNFAELMGLNLNGTWASPPAHPTFSGAYFDHNCPMGIQASDSMESYANNAALNGLNGPSGWNGAYVDH